MPKIEDELRSEFIKEFGDEHRIHISWWLSRLSQYHQAKMEELAKKIDELPTIPFGNENYWVKQPEVLKIIREGN